MHLVLEHGCLLVLLDGPGLVLEGTYPHCIPSKVNNQMDQAHYLVFERSREFHCLVRQLQVELADLEYIHHNSTNLQRSCKDWEWE